MPEEFSKFTLLKFIGDEHKIGGDLLKTLKKSYALLEFDILKYKSETALFIESSKKKDKK